MSEPAKHGPGWNGDDRTLCGVAEDAFQSNDWYEPVVIAKPGESISCTDCKQLVKHVRQAVRRGSYVVI